MPSAHHILFIHFLASLSSNINIFSTLPARASTPSFLSHSILSILPTLSILSYSMAPFPMLYNGYTLVLDFSIASSTSATVILSERATDPQNVFRNKLLFYRALNPRRNRWKPKSRSKQTPSLPKRVVLE